jgi:hypothetical protein
VPKTSVNFSRTGTGQRRAAGQRRLELRPVLEVFAASSSPTYIVGTPMKIVHFSFDEQLERLRAVEARQHDDAGADEEGRVHAARLAEGVEQRQAAQHDVVRP